jgi:hypothetical protein
MKQLTGMPKTKCSQGSNRLSFYQMLVSSAFLATESVPEFVLHVVSCNLAFDLLGPFLSVIGHRTQHKSYTTITWLPRDSTMARVPIIFVADEITPLRLSL